MSLPEKPLSGKRGTNVNGAAPAKTRLKSCTRSNPCPVCGGHRRCSIGEDGLLFCREKQGEQPGFVHLGAARADNGFHLYRRQDDPVIIQREEERKARQGNGQADNGHLDWERLAADYRAALTPERRDELANILGLPAAVLHTLDVGWNNSANSWTLPEMDAEDRVIGIGQRRRDGSKNQVTGGRRGLYVPRGWMERGGPLLLPEGPSNTLTLTALGLSAIGRPSNLAGIDHLARILAGFPADRKIIVVGDFDPKPNGLWPGLAGCQRTAAELTQRLQRKVSWVLPPPGFKDVRGWTNAQGLPLDCADSWNEAGEQLLADLCARCKEADVGAANTALGPGAELAAPRFHFRTSAEFLQGDYRPQWLIRQLLVRGQPAVIGGPKKSLKTTLLVDLAYSLASGTDFLGRFAVPEKVRVGIMSGESGEFTLKETALRVSSAKGINANNENVLWEFILPRLAYPADLDALQAAIRDTGLAALLIDPLYLCVLAGIGASGLSSSNLFQMGPLYMAVARTCLSVGCTPILATHFKITRPNAYDEPQLEDLAYAGIQEFARQWLLVGRRERYVPDSGQHKLWLSAGGSMGHSGLWALDIDEGRLDEDFGGRQWGVSIETATEAREAEAQIKQRQKTEQERQRESDEEQRVLGALGQIDPQNQGASFTKLRNRCGLSGTKANQAIARLLVAAVLEEVAELEIEVGSGARRKVRGIRRKGSEGD